MQKISWFLQAPEDYHCRHCGTYNSPKEIKESHLEHHDAYQKVMGYYNSHTKDQLREMFKDDRHIIAILKKAVWSQELSSYRKIHLNFIFLLKRVYKDEAF